MLPLLASAYFLMPRHYNRRGLLIPRLPRLPRLILRLPRLIPRLPRLPPFLRHHRHLLIRKNTHKTETSFYLIFRFILFDIFNPVLNRFSESFKENIVVAMEDVGGFFSHT